MTAKGPYSRIYWSIVDDPLFARVYDNDHALATWFRMLLMADAMYPASAPMTTRNPTVRLLIDCGLIIERPGNRYSVRGLQAERERRSAIGRNAAGVRWQSERNANAMPSKAEHRREEQIGASAPMSDDERTAAIAENMRIMNDPTVEGSVRRAAESTVARLRRQRESA